MKQRYLIFLVEMSQPPFINFFLGKKSSFLSVISWEVRGMRLKEELHFPSSEAFFQLLCLTENWQSVCLDIPAIM